MLVALSRKHNDIIIVALRFILYLIGEYGFLQEMRRTNVAVTRARRHLALVGDSATVSNEPFIKGLISFCHERGEVASAYDYLNGMPSQICKY